MKRAQDWNNPLLILLLAVFPSCASVRQNAFVPIDFSDQAPALLFQSECNGRSFTTRGVVVCEQKEPSKAKVSVKVPPLEGRIVYSNGVITSTDDFNWYPKKGFIFRKKPLKDTWATLDLGEVTAIFGDWPVAVDVMAVASVGVINTRGILYHRICNDSDIPCSRLIVEYECATRIKRTGSGEIGKCDRMAGSPQAFTVRLSGDGFKAAGKAKVYVQAPRIGFALTKEVQGDDFKFEIPQVPRGPMLVGIRLSWIEGDAKKSEETRILINGTNPAWVPLDQPHSIQDGESVDFVRPVMSDLMEANLYENGELKKKQFTDDKEISDFPLPQTDNGLSCAYAWGRSASDLQATCLNKKGEVQ